MRGCLDSFYEGGMYMVFKRNITITLACIITECLLSLIPTIIIIYCFFMLDKINEIFSTLLLVPYLILIINVALIIISFVCQIFIKTRFYVGKESLVIKEKENTREIAFNKINEMTYDFGCLTKFNGRPSQLVLFDKDFKELLSINNPSIIMVHMIKKRCKNVKMNYFHSKRFLYFVVVINSVVLLIAILANIFS